MIGGGPKPRLAALVAAAVPGAAFALLLAAAFGALRLTLPAAQREAVWSAVEPNAALVLMIWFFASLAAGWYAHRLWQMHAAAPGRLAERVQVLLAEGAEGTSAGAAAEGSVARDGNATRALLDAGEGASPDSVNLIAAVAALVMQRDALRREMAERVAEGSREVEQEKSRLAALMAELTQSVVVCNLDGRILL
ncbi:MAG: hypothetical protein U1F67_26610, partial [Rubrivivax sp.]